MRISIITIALFCFIASGWAASINPKITAMRKPTPRLETASKIKPVSALKLSKFAFQPVAIKSPGSDPPPAPMSGQTGSNASDAYKSGSGVVLRPAFLTDPVTGSVGTIYTLSLNADTLTRLQNKEIDIHCVADFIDQAHSTVGTALFGGFFRSIPQGMHTYLFTCRFFGGDDVKDRLLFYVGDKQLGPDKQVVNPSTDEISLIFTYQPESQYLSYLNVHAYLKPNDSANTYARGLHFWYMQLVQIN
ncbi:MAG: hypothetical protein ACYC0V_11310 [Armatimonadota bacterium]